MAVSTRMMTVAQKFVAMIIFVGLIGVLNMYIIRNRDIHDCNNSHIRVMIPACVLNFAERASSFRQSVILL